MAKRRSNHQSIYFAEKKSMNLGFMGAYLEQTNSTTSVLETGREEGGDRAGREEGGDREGGG